jgi:putative FmdB family regulatory protein
MPIYEYQCAGCQHTFDKLQKISDVPTTMCPSCKEEKAVRLVSPAGFQLKGTGWYVTDFKDKKKTEAAPSKSKEATTSTNPSATTEAKVTSTKKGEVD